MEPLIKERAETWFDAELLSGASSAGGATGQLFDGINFAFAEKVSFKEKSDLTQTIKKLGGSTYLFTVLGNNSNITNRRCDLYAAK